MKKLTGHDDSTTVRRSFTHSLYRNWFHAKQTRSICIWFVVAAAAASGIPHSLPHNNQLTNTSIVLLPAVSNRISLVHTKIFTIYAHTELHQQWGSRYLPFLFGRRERYISCRRFCLKKKKSPNKNTITRPKCGVPKCGYCSRRRYIRLAITYYRN